MCADIAAGLGAVTSLKTLRLEKNEIAAEGAAAILEALQENRSLERLELAGNCNEALSVAAWFAARQRR